MQMKYKQYLASREWALKREAVRERSGGICERCRRNPMSAVHHLDYSNIFNEPLADLQAICEDCHLYESGRCNVDPRKQNWTYLAYFKVTSGLIDIAKTGFLPDPDWTLNQLVILEKYFPNFKYGDAIPYSTFFPDANGNVTPVCVIESKIQQEVLWCCGKPIDGFDCQIVEVDADKKVVSRRVERYTNE